MLRKSFKTFDLYSTLAILFGGLYVFGLFSWGVVVLSGVLCSFLWSRAICKMNTANHYTSFKSVELYVFLAFQGYVFLSWYLLGDIKYETDYLMFSWVPLAINQINWNLSRSLVKHIVRVPNVMF